MEYLKELEKYLEEKDFISNPLETINELLKSIPQEYIHDCLVTIHIHNQNVIEKKEIAIKELEEKITIIPKQTSKEPETKTSTSIEQQIIYKNLEDKIKLLLNSSEEDLTKNIDTINIEDLPRIKLLIYKEILELTKQIKETIYFDTTKEIKSLQTKLNKYKRIFNAIKITLEIEQQTNEEVEEQLELKDIILIPTGKGTSYFEEDITNNINQKNKIKHAYSKLMRGIFINSTKPIVGKSEKLLEYYNKKNGIRVFYIVINDNKYAICGILFKDKTTSTRLNQEYDNCINRFLKNKEYILENLDNPLFYTEQEELHERIEQLLYTGKKLQLIKDGE